MTGDPLAEGIAIGKYAANALYVSTDPVIYTTKNANSINTTAPNFNYIANDPAVMRMQIEIDQLKAKIVEHDAQIGILHYDLQRERESFLEQLKEYVRKPLHDLETQLTEYRDYHDEDQQEIARLNEQLKELNKN